MKHYATVGACPLETPEAFREIFLADAFFHIEAIDKFHDFSRRSLLGRRRRRNLAWKHQV
jgi:hypothetical protein